ncbi:MAG: Rdx family protein [Acidobacteria bacterium]|nr:Rdx family protein [Acidobacteriota bacterium]
MPRAAGLAAELEEEFGLPSQLIKSRNGVFEVTLDDHLLYSKKSTHRFPEPGEVADLVREHLAS